MSIPGTEALHLLTYSKDSDNLIDGRTHLFVDSCAKFCGYLESLSPHFSYSAPEALSPSFKGMNLKEIIDQYIAKRNHITNGKRGKNKVTSSIDSIGFTDHKGRHLFLDTEYQDREAHMTLDDFIKHGKPSEIKITQTIDSIS